MSFFVRERWVQSVNFFAHPEMQQALLRPFQTTLFTCSFLLQLRDDEVGGNRARAAGPTAAQRHRTDTVRSKSMGSFPPGGALADGHGSKADCRNGAYSI